MIRNDILDKINTEVNRLKEIKRYLEEDYKKKESNETFVFLFDVYNSMIDADNNSKKIGSHILNF